jgi:hypothetical protein
MSKSNTTENDVLLNIFQNTDFSWDAGVTLYVSLHTSDPGEAGIQTTNETGYGSYARQAVARDATGWDVVGNVASNDDLIQFPQCSGTPQTITHVGIGTTLAAGGQLLYSGALSASLAVSAGIQPQFAIGALTITED